MATVLQKHKVNMCYNMATVLQKHKVNMCYNMATVPHKHTVNMCYNMATVLHKHKVNNQIIIMCHQQTFNNYDIITVSVASPYVDCQSEAQS